MATKAKIEVLENLVSRYLEKLPEKAHQPFREAVEAANELVNKIESRPPTTQAYYGDYLSACSTPEMVGVFLCAGANRVGLGWVMQINGWN